MHPENHFGDTVIGFIVESVFIFRVQFNYIHCEAASTQSFLTKSHTNRSLSMHSQKNPTSLPMFVYKYLWYIHTKVHCFELKWGERKYICLFAHVLCGREASRQRDPITFVVAYFNDDKASIHAAMPRKMMRSSVSKKKNMNKTRKQNGNWCSSY